MKIYQVVDHADQPVSRTAKSVFEGRRQASALRTWARKYRPGGGPYRVQEAEVGDWTDVSD